MSAANKFYTATLIHAVSTLHRIDSQVPIVAKRLSTRSNKE